jgi:hypothetical protein
MSLFRKFDSTFSSDPDSRLETPAAAGFRSGMSSSGVIGRKLGSLYQVKSEIPQDIHSALRDLRSKLSHEG